jgi:hypothetical protein
MAKKIPLTITHEPRAAAIAMTSPTVIHREREKSGVKYYEGVFYDDNGNPIKGDTVDSYNVKICRATCELAGAYPYIFNTLSWVCTHGGLGKEIKDLDPNGFYYSLTMTWEKFIEITLDKYIEQKHYLTGEISNLVSKAQAKIIPFDETSSVFGQPVIIALRAGDGRNLSPQAVKGISNLRKEPIGTIQILFLKSLFRDALNHTKYFNEPKAFYAMLRHNAIRVTGFKKEQMAHIQGIIKSHEGDFSLPMINDKMQAIGELFGNPAAGLQAVRGYIEQMDVKKAREYEGDNFISAYNRIWQFIKLHDNNLGSRIRINIIELLSHTAPQYIQEKDGKKYIKGRKDAITFLDAAMAIIWTIDKDTPILNIQAINYDESGERIIISVRMRDTKSQR